MSGKHRTGAGADGGGPQRTSAAAEQAAEPWNVDWAAERAADALRYLGKNYPKCQGALRALDPHEEAAHEAEQARKDREADSLERFTAAFVAAGGRKADAEAAWRAERNKRAAATASAREERVMRETTRRRMGVL